MCIIHTLNVEHSTVKITPTLIQLCTRERTHEPTNINIKTKDLFCFFLFLYHTKSPLEHFVNRCQLCDWIRINSCSGFLPG